MKPSLAGIEGKQQASEHETQQHAVQAGSKDTKHEDSVGRFHIKRALSFSPRRGGAATGRPTTFSASQGNGVNNTQKSLEHENRHLWGSKSHAQQTDDSLDKTVLQSVHGGMPIRVSSPNATSIANHQIPDKSRAYEACEWLSVSSKAHTPAGSTLLGGMGNTDSYSPNRRSPDQANSQGSPTSSEASSFRPLTAAAIARVSSYRSSLASTFDLSIMTPHASLSGTYDNESLVWAMGGLINPKPVVFRDVNNNVTSPKDADLSSPCSSPRRMLSRQQDVNNAASPKSADSSSSSPRRMLSRQEHVHSSLASEQSQLQLQQGKQPPATALSAHTNAVAPAASSTQLVHMSRVAGACTQLARKSSAEDTVDGVVTTFAAKSSTNNASSNNAKVNTVDTSTRNIAVNAASNNATNNTKVNTANNAKNSTIVNAAANNATNSTTNIGASGASENAVVNNTANKPTHDTTHDKEMSNETNARTLVCSRGSNSDPDTTQPQTEPENSHSGTTPIKTHTRNSEPEISNSCSPLCATTAHASQSPGARGTFIAARKRSVSVPAQPGFQDAVSAYNISMNNLSSKVSSAANSPLYSVRKSVCAAHASAPNKGTSNAGLRDRYSSFAHPGGSTSLLRTDYSFRGRLTYSRCVCMVVCVCVCVCPYSFRGRLTYSRCVLCACMCLCVQVRVYVTYTYIHTYTHTYMHTGNSKWQGPQVQAACVVHTHIHTYMHTHIHTYIHTGTTQAVANGKGHKCKQHA
jgi:hypothetical protein